MGTQSVQWLRRLINAKQKRVGGRKGLFGLTVQGDGAHYRGAVVAALTRSLVTLLPQSGNRDKHWCSAHLSPLTASHDAAGSM